MTTELHGSTHGATTLEALLERLGSIAQVSHDPELAERLPSFGGEHPGHPVETWSWDEERLLVGPSTRALRIVQRLASIEIESEVDWVHPSDEEPGVLLVEVIVQLVLHGEWGVNVHGEVTVLTSDAGGIDERHLSGAPEDWMARDLLEGIRANVTPARVEDVVKLVRNAALRQVRAYLAGNRGASLEGEDVESRIEVPPAIEESSQGWLARLFGKRKR